MHISEGIIHLVDTTAQLAQLEGCQSAKQEVVSSNPHWTINQGETMPAVNLLSQFR